LWTKTCTLLHCDSWLNPGRIVASLRLWKDTRSLWTKTCTLPACEPWLARCFTATLGWTLEGSLFTATLEGLYSRLVNQDLCAASLRLWKDSAHGVWTNSCKEGASLNEEWLGTHDVKTCQTCLLNLSVRLLWEVRPWLSSRLSRMAFSSEEHLIHTESAAPAKGGRPETWIEEAAGPDHLTAVDWLFDCLVLWLSKSDGFAKRGASYTHRECCTCQSSTSRTLNWRSCWLWSFLAGLMMIDWLIDWWLFWGVPLTVGTLRIIFLLRNHIFPNDKS